MTSSLRLLSPVTLGPYKLPNRIVMGPLTRNRAINVSRSSGETAINVPHQLNVTYYSQRASAGLIISEATQVSPQGQGYPMTPGIHSPEQIEGWRAITDAVHERGGHMFLQLWHVGRISHPDLQPGGALPVAPSAIAPEGMASTFEGEKPFVTPRALETNEIPGIVEQFRQGAKNALAAGFDGVEVHSANGYLLDQFLQDGSNHRTDQYGGSIENRARLLMEVLEAVTQVWGADRVGVRLSPSGTFSNMSDSNSEALFTYVVKALNQFGLAYLHLVEPRVDGNVTLEANSTRMTSGFFRPMFHGTLLSAGGYDRDSGEAVLAAGEADLIVYGRLFIANPDLPERFAQSAELNAWDRNTFYGGGEKGYTDYPALDRQTA
ncbi:MAG: alkene reductase [Myxacorys californica WJT36-NPBG1]|nr:alkene reductase [Myxacorys californica WJT36-NPBG1]